MFSVISDLLNFTNLVWILTAAVLSIYLKRFLPTSNLPPGPWGLPIIGHLPFLSKRAELEFSKWADEYGPVMSVRLGNQPTVILSSLEVVEQAFMKQPQVYNGRYTTYFTTITTENAGIIFLDDPVKWNIHRRFGLKAVGSGGQLGNNIESIVQEESDHLCEKIKENEGMPFIVERDLFLFIANVISRVTISEKITETQHEALKTKFLENIDAMREDGMAYFVLAVMPWTRFFPPILKHFKHILLEKQKTDDVMNLLINEHDNSFDVNHPRDMVDLYLSEVKANKPGYSCFHLGKNLADIYVAGTETSTSTVRWVLLYLIKYPEVQKRVHQEIDEIVGKEGKISLHADLPYTRAVIQEVYRIDAAVPLSVPRRTTQDSTLMGYKIPKDTQIIPNIYKLHNDPTVWPNPRVFKPSRHLDNDGKFVKSSHVIPFSIGQRNCMGENLARIEVFLFVVKILQKFQLCPDPENPVPGLGAIFGVFHSPEHYRIVFKAR